MVNQFLCETFACNLCRIKDFSWCLQLYIMNRHKLRYLSQLQRIIGLNIDEKFSQLLSATKYSLIHYSYLVFRLGIGAWLSVIDNLNYFGFEFALQLVFFDQVVEGLAEMTHRSMPKQ